MKGLLPLALCSLLGCEALEAPAVTPPAASSPARAPESDRWLQDPRENAVLRVVADAEATLMGGDGFELPVGSRCGFAPSLRPWFAVRYLLAARRTDTLQRIAAEAPTAEGRIWAAYGLVQAGQLDNDDIGDIADEAALPVWVCDGCLTWQARATEAIAHL